MNKILLVFVLLLSSCVPKRLVYRVTTPEGVFECPDYRVEADTSVNGTVYRIRLYKYNNAPDVDKEFITKSYSVESFYRETTKKSIKGEKE